MKLNDLNIINYLEIDPSLAFNLSSVELGEQGLLQHDQAPAFTSKTIPALRIFKQTSRNQTKRLYKY
jgi:hypothetical protein